MLDFYRGREVALLELKTRQELETERMQVTKDMAAATRDSSEEVADVPSRLATLNDTAAGQANDVTTIKWIDMIDSLFGH